MKNLILTAFLVFAVFVSSASAAKLVVATDTNFPPFEFKDPETGQHVGFDVELWAAIAKEAGLDYELQPMAFKGIVPGLQSSQLDVGIAGMSITDERKLVIDFSDGYYDSGLLILVPKDSPIKGLADLAGKTVATKTGTTSVDFLKEKSPETKLTLFPNDNAMFMELMTGGAEAVMFDKPVVESFLSKSGADKVAIVGDLYSGQPYGIGFPKGSPIVAKVNAALATLKANGEYAKIYKKWFGVAPR